MIKDNVLADLKVDVDICNTTALLLGHKPRWPDPYIFMAQHDMMIRVCTCENCNGWIQVKAASIAGHEAGGVGNMIERTCEEQQEVCANDLAGRRMRHA